MVTTKLEVLVDFGPNVNENTVNQTLNDLKTKEGIKGVEFKDGAILLETSLPNRLVLDMVEKSSGRRAVLQGFGDHQSAVAMVSSQGCSGSVMGVIRFQQTNDGKLVVDGSIDALPPGKHGLHVRSDGDLSQGCVSIGGHFNPTNSPHGGPNDPHTMRHAGDLGNVAADETGRASFTVVDNMLKLSDIIGRAIAITECEDDLGKGKSPNSRIDGNSGPPIACGIIARSAGIFQNPKRICQCDGVVVWDERDRPLAGFGRRKPNCCDRHKTDQLDNETKPCCKF